MERLKRLGGDCTWFGCVPSKVPEVVGDFGSFWEGDLYMALKRVGW